MRLTSTIGMNISGLTRPQTSLMIAFSHSTDSGVGGECRSARWVCIAIRTRSSSFSILRPAFSAPTQAANATPPRSALRTKKASQETCLPVATRNQINAQRAEVVSAPVRRIFFALEMSTGSTGGGNDCRQMLPTSATAGAGKRWSWRDGSDGLESAGPGLLPFGSSESGSRTPFFLKSARG
jgi:hypothetical protein